MGEQKTDLERLEFQVDSVLDSLDGLCNGDCADIYRACTECGCEEGSCDCENCDCEIEEICNCDCGCDLEGSCSCWLNDFYDIRLNVDYPSGSIRGAEFVVMIGGPNVVINTLENAVMGYWWSDKVVKHFDSSVSDTLMENFLGHVEGVSFDYC